MMKKEDKKVKSKISPKRFFPENRRGQGLSTNAIILIILGIVILVVLIVGFTVGWGKLAPWLSSENVDDIVVQCQSACSTNSVFGYCSTMRDLNDGTNKIKDATCFYLSEKQTQYGIDKCPSAKCADTMILSDKTTEAEATNENPCNPDDPKVVYYLEGDTLKSVKCLI